VPKLLHVARYRGYSGLDGLQLWKLGAPGTMTLLSRNAALRQLLTTPHVVVAHLVDYRCSSLVTNFH
jgi:hypothetical protein